MQESRDPSSRRRGLWWKSLLVAWLGLPAVAAVARALEVDLPEEAGYPALAVSWVSIWVIWRRWAAEDRREAVPGALGVMQRMWAAFVIAVVLIGVVVLTLDASGALERTDSSAAVVALLVILTGSISLVGGRIWVPRLDGSDRASLVRSYRNRFLVKVAWAEAPALVAFAGFLLLGGEAWVYLIGLATSLAGFALAAPSRASLRRDQAKLDASGAKFDLLEALSGAPAS